MLSSSVLTFTILRMPMAALPPSNSKSSGDAAGQNAPLTFEEKLNQFWQKNRMVVLGLCVLILAVLLGKGIWERVQRDKEQQVETAYTEANTPDQLRAFVAAHPDHELAAVAEVRLADEAFTAGKYADAIAAYDKGIAVLKSGPLVSRARLGRAIAEVQSGKTTDGTTELKQLADDTTLLNAVRAEAAYNLAALAADAGNSADAQKYIDQLNQIDPASMWARRAMALQANLPRPAAASSLAPSLAPAATSTSTSTAQPSSTGIKLNLPGK